jgi:hypothetical protein
VRTMDLDGCDTGSNEDERARMAAQLPILHTAVRCGAEGSAFPRGVLVNFAPNVQCVGKNCWRDKLECCHKARHTSALGELE